MKGRTALITGITGQDGSYLAEFLLEKGYRVVGMVRRSSAENFHRIEHIRHRIELEQADLLDQYSLIDLMRRARPDEVYNLAAMSFVPTSWSQPVLTAEFDATSTLQKNTAADAARTNRKAAKEESDEDGGLLF